MAASTQDPPTVAEAYLAGLRQNGIRHVFANAGTDFAPIVEGLLAAGESGAEIPNFITVPHENVAMSMAHGYYLTCGEPVAVMVHTTVGTANAICALMNASRDNVPVLLAAGRTPHTETGHHGSRGGAIHWGQENFDQAGMVREYVKWDYELRDGQPAERVVGRAMDVAMSEPRGPVYMTLPREVLGNPAVAGPDASADRQPGAIAAAPAADAIEQAASRLAEAESPVILTSGAGQRLEMVGLLGAFAKAYAIPVVENWPRCMNLPSDHPMNVGAMVGPMLEAADVVLVIDSEVPWTPSRNALKDDVTIINIASDPLYARIPTRGFQNDMAIAGASWLALPMLQDALKSKMRGKKTKIDKRRKEVAAARAEMLAQRKDMLERMKGQRPIHSALIADAINKVASGDPIVVNELGIPAHYLDLSAPGSLIGNSLAGGLGFGIGAALGAKLAAPDRPVIAAVGDGSYMFGNPTPCHFVGRAENLPTLTLVSNNGMWNAVKASTLGMYPDGRASKANKVPLVDLQPSPDFEQTIAACGGYGERVEDPDDLVPAMERAMEKVEGGTQALLNIITRPGR